MTDTEITNSQIRALKDEAAAAGDYLQVAYCLVALDRYDEDDAPAHVVAAARAADVDPDDRNAARDVCADVVAAAGVY